MDSFSADCDSRCCLLKGLLSEKREEATVLSLGMPPKRVVKIEEGAEMLLSSDFFLSIMLSLDGNSKYFRESRSETLEGRTACGTKEEHAISFLDFFKTT